MFTKRLIEITTLMLFSGYALAENPALKEIREELNVIKWFQLLDFSLTLIAIGGVLFLVYKRVNRLEQKVDKQIYSLNLEIDERFKNFIKELDKGFESLKEVIEKTFNKNKPI